jgi:hypothetical protein
VAITEESRYQLFQRLEELLGPEKVATLMELLPPVGWADVATRRDLDHLQSALDAKIDAAVGSLDAKIDAAYGSLDAKIDATHGSLGTKIDALEGRVDRLGLELRAEMFREQRNQTLAIIGANTTITALLFAAFRLL